MVDTLSREERSERMSRIKGKDTKPELALRRILHGMGFRYRLHDAGLPGKPDLVLQKYKTVIFVHGCFWHRHALCKIATTPKSNTQFWLDKFRKNIVRDAYVIEALQNSGWKVLIVWECELANPEKAMLAAQRLADLIHEQSGIAT